MGTSATTKSFFRKSYLERRKTMPLQEVQSLQAMMVEHMASMPWPNVKYVLSYKTAARRHEPSMHLFENALLHFHRSTVFCYPRTALPDCSMDAIADDDEVVWQLSTFGIEEPAIGTIIPPEEFQLIFVPLLAFDKRGYRVGYGKGFYDRYLKRCRPDVMTVGFSLFPPEEAIKDINANDVPLKYCITPHQLYVF